MRWGIDNLETLSYIVDMKKKLKASVRQNRYGNWRGYVGGKYVREFFLEPAFLVAGEMQVGDMGSDMPEVAQQWLKEHNEK